MEARTRGLVWWGLAVIAGTAFFIWLGSDFRPDGVLGFLQTYCAWLYFFPYLLGAVWGGTAHNPSDLGYAAGFLMEIAIIALVLRYVVGRLVIRTK